MCSKNFLRTRSITGIDIFPPKNGQIVLSVRTSENKPMTVMTLAAPGFDGCAVCRLTLRGAEVPLREMSVATADGKDKHTAGVKLALRLRGRSDALVWLWCRANEVMIKRSCSLPGAPGCRSSL